MSARVRNSGDGDGGCAAGGFDVGVIGKRNKKALTFKTKIRANPLLVAGVGFEPTTW